MSLLSSAMEVSQGVRLGNSVAPGNHRSLTRLLMVTSKNPEKAAVDPLVNVGEFAVFGCLSKVYSLWQSVLSWKFFALSVLHHLCTCVW